MVYIYMLRLCINHHLNDEQAMTYIEKLHHMYANAVFLCMF